jgi:hypothetical protein
VWRRSDKTKLSLVFNEGVWAEFVRMGIEIAQSAGAFQADDEGSIPFTRSSLR